MSVRSISAWSAVDIPLVPDDLAPEQVLEGSPRTRIAELPSSVSTVEVGVWEITPGVVTDVEADEILVVLEGRATVEADGLEIDLRPGTVAILRAGARTVWRVHETLRKVYVVFPAPAP